MVKCSDLKLMAQVRLDEAKVLLANGFYDGAAYICGYVVELSLKAMICKNLKINEYPDDGKDKNIFSTHDFDRLLLLAGLQNKLTITSRALKKIWSNWSLLTAWKPERRYITGFYNKSSVDSLITALEHPRDGFFTWIKKKW